MFRLVVDTDVMVAALESATGASRQVLLRILRGEAQALLSTALMLEYEAVLTRPNTLARSGLEAADIWKILDEFARICSPVVFDYRWRPLAADEDDDFVIETAINGAADAIASFNVRDIVKGAASFGIAVERPALILRRMRQ
ncbi:MAG TPA: putative toxin-antitoxin system toxin component, PIN family [Rhodospirillaceae bacterium]|nr:putative toxin-antitoxin system toxin component, PIN family [Rhodospirillaceae bacterium]